MYVHCLLICHDSCKINSIVLSEYFPDILCFSLTYNVVTSNCAINTFCWHLHFNIPFSRTWTADSDCTKRCWETYFYPQFFISEPQNLSEFTAQRTLQILISWTEWGLCIERIHYIWGWYNLALSSDPDNF